MQHEHGLHIPQTLEDECTPQCKRTFQALAFGAGTIVTNSGKIHDFLARGER
jgi:hypothetical protein